MNPTFKELVSVGCWWLRPIILAMWEAEIRGSGFKASPSKKEFVKPPISTGK
jgi:hypothetical protein